MGYGVWVIKRDTHLVSFLTVRLAAPFLEGTCSFRGAMCC